MGNESAGVAGGAGGMGLRFAARTHQGLVRRGNQDSAYVGPRLLAVADGMGGMAAGDLASAIVIAALAPLDEGELGGSDNGGRGSPVVGPVPDAPADAPTDADPAGAGPADAGRPAVAVDGGTVITGKQAIEELRVAVERANLRLHEAVTADPARRGMGTTLTALLFVGTELALVHIGDSRAYLLRTGELSQITRDDTFVQLLVDDGHITEEEAQTHPQRFLVTKALQGSGTPAEYALCPMLLGDRYLLCSDGLSGVVEFATLRSTLQDYRDLDQCADRLIELALDAGAPDNVTVVLADLVSGDPGPGQPAVLGAAASI